MFFFFVREKHRQILGVLGKGSITKIGGCTKNGGYIAKNDKNIPNNLAKDLTTFFGG